MVIATRSKGRVGRKLKREELETIDDQAEIELIAAAREKDAK